MISKENNRQQVKKELKDIINIRIQTFEIRSVATVSVVSVLMSVCACMFVCVAGKAEMKVQHLTVASGLCYL